MTWTSAKPKVPGWYWWRDTHGIYLANVYWLGVSTPYLSMALHGTDSIIFKTPVETLTRGEWAGPLEPPT